MYKEYVYVSSTGNENVIKLTSKQSSYTKIICEQVFKNMLPGVKFKSC